MNINTAIHKAGGILMRDRKILVERSRDKKFFIAPGGRVQTGETAEQALVRELKEEFTISVSEDGISYFGSFSAAAVGERDTTITMDVFIVKSWRGEPVPSGEVEEILWINSRIPATIQVGSIIEHEIIPRLKKLNLID